MQAEARARSTTERTRLPLGEWIPTVSVGYQYPKHLQPLLDVFARIDAGECVRAVLHAPPRHAKTDTLMHGVPWLLERHPRLKAGYFTYADDLSREKSRNARRIAETAGIRLDKEAESQWTTIQGGGLVADGVGGVFTGRGVDLLILDDLFKNRLEADSSLIRERRWEWWESVALTRLEPNASTLVCGTRWHPDDVQGRLVKLGWEYICLPALDPEERPLWPERWTTAQLTQTRDDVGPYAWVSLYQGQPRPRGGKVFGDPTVYQALPETGLRYAIGIDLAYSEKTYADWSVAVVLAHDGTTAYVVEVIREQRAAPAFKAELRRLCYRYPSARVVFKGAGPEKGSVDLMRTPDPNPARPERPLPGINVEFESAREDKFQRAQPVAAAWNRGAVQLPEQAPWLNKFLDEVRDFTGIADSHDDQVDGLGTAYDALSEPMPGYEGWGPSVKRRM